MKDRFGSTTYAQQAALLVAKSQYEIGQLDSAKAALAWVAEKGSDKGYVSLAKLRLAAILLDTKAYDEALKVLGPELSDGFSALQADRRGDIYAAQGKKAEAREQYQKAYKALEERNDYRRLVEVKLNALGVQAGDAAK
jgi:predicted negative regulator of RcsB-dependent stress response